MFFKEGLEVLARGLELPFGQPDNKRLGELEEAAALSPAADRQLGASSGRLERLVGLEMERPGSCYGGDLLVLGETRAYDRRLIMPAQECALVDHRRAHPQRAVACPSHPRQSRSPDRSLGDLPHDGEDLFDWTPDNRHDLELIHLALHLPRARTGVTAHPATARPG